MQTSPSHNIILCIQHNLLTSEHPLGSWHHLIEHLIVKDLSQRLNRPKINVIGATTPNATYIQIEGIDSCDENIINDAIHILGNTRLKSRSISREIRCIQSESTLIKSLQVGMLLDTPNQVEWPASSRELKVFWKKSLRIDKVSWRHCAKTKSSNTIQSNISEVRNTLLNEFTRGNSRNAHTCGPTLHLMTKELRYSQEELTCIRLHLEECDKVRRLFEKRIIHTYALTYLFWPEIKVIKNRHFLTIFTFGEAKHMRPIYQLFARLFFRDLRSKISISESYYTNFDAIISYNRENS